MIIRRAIAFLASLPFLSVLFSEVAERPYRIGIEGCESGGIDATQPALLMGALRPIARLYTRETCSFRGNLMENPDPNVYFVCGPAGEYRVTMGQDDGPIHYLPACVTIPAGEMQGCFTVSLQGEKSTTGIRIYRREDFARAYPRGYFLDKGQREEQVDLPAMAESHGKQLEATLPFGHYMIQEERTPADERESDETIYALNITRR